MTSFDEGQSFGEEKIIGDQSISGCGCCAYAWEYSSCPVSTNNLTRDTKSNNWTTWETAGKIYITNLKDRKKITLIHEPKQDVRQKHSVVFNNTEYKAIIWSEGIGYFSGGELQI